MNTSRTLEQLEAIPWPNAAADSTSMVQRCHALRKVPISKLSRGEIRLLIGQDIGTKLLLPRALGFLENEPLVAADYFPGDLLLALFRVPSTYWSGNHEAFKLLVSVAQRAGKELSAQTEPLSSNLKLLKEVNAFLNQNDA
jgi:hypothetical protein